jgi:transposase
MQSYNLPDIDIEAITSLPAAKRALRQLMDCLETVMARQKALEQENESLKAELARLKKQSPKPSFTPGHGPHPASGTAFSATKLLDQPRQWQKHARTPIPIDEHVQLPEVDQCDCGSTTFRTISTETKVIQGIRLIRHNTAYRRRRKVCTHCGRVQVSPLPAETKGLSFDRDTQALASFLKYACRMTMPRIYQCFTGFGLQISTGEIAQLLKRSSQALYPAYTQLRTVGIRSSHFLQSDSTASKRQLPDGRIITQHLHVVANPTLSLFKVTKYYNARVMNRLLGRYGKRKPFVSDDASANGRLLRVRHKQVCWVHELRHYLKLSPRLKVHREQLQAVIAQLVQFYREAKAYQAQPTEVGKQALRRQFTTVTKQTTGYGSLDHQLSLTRRKRERLLLFLDYPFVPIHNNQCEQDLRELVVMRRISHETKSLGGDRSLERHMSVIQTARKQGLHVYDTLYGLITGRLTPAVLTEGIR